MQFQRRKVPLGAWILGAALLPGLGLASVLGCGKVKTYFSVQTPQARQDAVEATRSQGCADSMRQANYPLPVWRTWKRDRTQVTVEVAEGFYRANMDDRKAFDALVRCAAAGGKSEGQGILMVRYLDAASGRTVAHWNEAGGLVMME